MLFTEDADSYAVITTYVVKKTTFANAIEKNINILLN